MPVDKMFKTNFQLQCVEHALYKLSKTFTKQFLIENILELIEEIYASKDS